MAYDSNIDSQPLRSDDDNGDTRHYHHHYHYHYHFDESAGGVSSPAIGLHPAKAFSFSSSTLSGDGSPQHAYPYPSFPYPPPHIPARTSDDLPLPLGEDVRVYCEAGTGLSLAVRKGAAVLAAADPSDESQHWIKDVEYFTKVEDAQGFPCFALVNKFTGLALRCAVGQSHPLRLTAYRPGVFDETVLWSMGGKMRDGYRPIRMVNKINMILDADKKYTNHKGVIDGTPIILWTWNEGDNQKWKLVPY